MKYKDAINQALYRLMQQDEKVIILGEGVTDPKHLFSTTELAHQHFPNRVIETPLSEGMLTGALAGLASQEYKPIYCHARSEFSLLGMEQLIDVIAKWPYLHNGQTLPIVIRMLVGRGWGQGPTHSQSFHGMLSGVPGLRVYYPIAGDFAAKYINDAMADSVPTIIFEPRRLYEEEKVGLHIGGHDAVVYTVGDVILEAIDAAMRLRNMGISVSTIPIQDMQDVGIPTAYDRPVLIVDTMHTSFGAAAEIAVRLAEAGNTRVRRLGPPPTPCPTSYPLEQAWYPSAEDIVRAVCELLGREYRPTEAVSMGMERDGRKEPF